MRAASAITFDASEAWELEGVDHPHRRTEEGNADGDVFWADATHFKLMPVAMHEARHHPVASTLAQICPSGSYCTTRSDARSVRAQMGHVLGLTHTFGPTDVMSPYYSPNRTTLSDADVAAAAAVMKNGV